MTAPLRNFARLLILPALLLFCALPDAHAHRVYIFAWAESGQICTESYFSKKAKVKGGTVLMLNTKGGELARSTGNENGVACFSPPEEAQDLLFVIEAGEGHKGDFLLPAAQVQEATAAAATAAKPAETPQIPAQPEPPAGGRPAPLSTGGTALSEEALRTIVREEVGAQLAPLRKELARQSGGDAPGWREIIGGLGWIAGLAALAVLARRRKEC